MREETVFLKILSENDVGEEYMGWMHDPEVTQYLESRWRGYSLEDLRAYVRDVNGAPTGALWGIFETASGRHVGNVKISPTHPIHRYADIGLLIGDRMARGKGYGTLAIELACRYARSEFNVRKLIAGIYAPNEPSYRAFIKAGFVEVGLLRQQRWCAGAYVDEHVMEKLL